MVVIICSNSLSFKLFVKPLSAVNIIAGVRTATDDLNSIEVVGINGPLSSSTKPLFRIDIYLRGVRLKLTRERRNNNADIARPFNLRKSSKDRSSNMILYSAV